MKYTILKQPRVYPNRVFYRSIKRVFDLTFCILMMPFILPVLAICGLAIFMDSSGPVFFVQERIGKGGRPFRMLKFRTMKSVIADSQCRADMQSYVKGTLDKDRIGNATYKPIKGEEITRVGRILRRTSLDELPQIINVLKGEMSIIGPRPNVPWEVDVYTPWHHERFEVMPGITGLAQVRGRSTIDFMSLVRYDIEYIEKQSPALDFQILWWTFKSLIRGKGAL